MNAEAHELLIAASGCTLRSTDRRNWPTSLEMLGLPINHPDHVLLFESMVARWYTSHGCTVGGKAPRGSRGVTSLRESIQEDVIKICLLHSIRRAYFGRILDQYDTRQKVAERVAFDINSNSAVSFAFFYTMRGENAHDMAMREAKNARERRKLQYMLLDRMAKQLLEYLHRYSENPAYQRIIADVHYNATDWRAPGFWVKWEKFREISVDLPHLTANGTLR